MLVDFRLNLIEVGVVVVVHRLDFRIISPDVVDHPGSMARRSDIRIGLQPGGSAAEPEATCSDIARQPSSNADFLTNGFMNDLK